MIGLGLLVEVLGLLHEVFEGCGDVELLPLHPVPEIEVAPGLSLVVVDSQESRPEGVSDDDDVIAGRVSLVFADQVEDLAISVGSDVVVEFFDLVG